MSFILPIAAAILQSGSATLDKVTLSIKNVTFKTYNGISFPLIFLFTLIIFLIIRPPVIWSQFTITICVLLLITSGCTIITNLLYYRALKKDLLSEMQTFSLLSSIPLIILTGILFVEERNLLIITFAIISALSLVWSHYERHHFKISKKTFPYFLWVIFIAPIGVIINKIILDTLNPITMQLIRDGFIAIIFVLIFFKSIKKVPKKAIPFLLITNILTSIAWIFYFYSFKINGVISTVLIFSIEPLLVYIYSLIFLKEKLHYKKLISFIIILITITLSQIF